MRKLLLLLILSLLFASFVPAQTLFQLVESVPEETVLKESSLPRAADVWADMIKSAKKTIDIEMFYIANEKGEPLEKIVNEIKSAAGRGVQVRIIIDNSFFQRYKESADDFINVKNISVKKIPFKKIGGGVMHAKYFIVDGEDLFLGSQNFDWRALKHIHEMGVRIKHKELASMFLSVFEADWKLCDDSGKEAVEEIKTTKTGTVYNNKNKLTITSEDFGKITLYPAFSPKEIIPEGFSDEESELLRLIENAKERLCFQFYSYSLKGSEKKTLYTKIDDALRNAAKRGVDIKIIFSDWAIKKGATEQIQSLSQVPGIEIKFSTIPQYSGGYIPYARVQHCKFFISDDEMSWVSTANLEQDYFYESRNVSLVLKSEKINSALFSVFERVWNSQYAVKVDADKEYKAVKRN
ncbi:MAG TPA: phospholipase D-like domain-containing protein [Ignavibacteria bacterium]|nr:phospholipase D-like domain-containing protein [Ignavibacteria bacterium]